MATAWALDKRIVPAAGAPTRDTQHPGRLPRSGQLTRQRTGQGIGLALGLLSAICFGTSGTFGSALMGAGWSPAGAVLARACVAALVLTVPALLALRRHWPQLRRSGTGQGGLGRPLWQVVSYGLVGVAGSQVCYFNAIARMDVGVSILLEYMGIILVVGWLWARHGQRPSLLTVLGGAAALGGLALMLDLSGSGGVNAAGVLWALAAAVAAAVYFFQSAARTDAYGAVPLPSVVLAWGGMLAGAATIALLGLLRIMPLRTSGAAVTLLNVRVSWLVPLLGLGLVAAAIAYVTGIAAARRLRAKLGSFVAMAEVLFAAGFAWVLLHQVPTGTQFLGGLLILAGVVAVRLDE